MTAFQFWLIVVMLFVIQVEIGLALKGLGKIHQEIGEHGRADEERSV